jgi:hypothetical protein
MGVDLEKNIQKIQNLVDEHPYNFPYCFILNWPVIKKKLLNQNREDGVKLLLSNIQAGHRLFTSKYLKEVLGLSKWEVKQFLFAMAGPMKEKANLGNKTKLSFNRFYGILIAGVLSVICFLAMYVLVWLGNPLLPIEQLAMYGFAWHHIPEFFCFFFFGWFLGEIVQALHKLQPGKKIGIVDIVYLLLLALLSFLELISGFSPLVVIPIVAIPSFLGYLIKRLHSSKKLEKEFLNSLIK